MIMHPVVSTNVRAVGYDSANRTLRVQFHSGSTYDYYRVSPGVFEEMFLPNPWRRIGRIIKAHAYARVA